ncbi:helix-turn-helix domain-containing protein [Afipia sp. TerB]
MQNASSVLYRPTPTPSQVKFAMRHRQFAEKVAASRPAPVVIAPEIAPAPVPLAPLSNEAMKAAWTEIEDAVAAARDYRPKLQQVMAAVCRHFLVSRTDLCSARRADTIVKPRQIYMYLAKKLTTRSYPEIARFCGGRDHTTAIWACQQVERFIVADPKIADAVKALTEELSATREPEVADA